MHRVPLLEIPDKVDTIWIVKLMQSLCFSLECKCMVMSSPYKLVLMITDPAVVSVMHASGSVTSTLQAQYICECPVAKTEQALQDNKQCLLVTAVKTNQRRLIQG